MGTGEVIYDTNQYVQHKKGKNPSPITRSFLFTDINLFEWLKGKPKETRKKEFEYIDNLIGSTHSEYRFRSQYSIQEDMISSPKPLSYRFLVAEKVAKKVFRDLLDIYIVVCNIALLAIVLKECDIDLSSGAPQGDPTSIADFQHINEALSLVWTRVRKKTLSKLSRSMYAERKEAVDDYGKAYFIILADCINQHSAFVSLQPVIGRVLNNNNIFACNQIRLSRVELERLVDVFIQPTQNEQATKQFVVSLMSPFVLRQARFEFNDVADFYLNYIATSISVPFVSDDDRWKRLDSESK